VIGLRSDAAVGVLARRTPEKSNGVTMLGRPAVDPDPSPRGGGRLYRFLYRISTGRVDIERF